MLISQASFPENPEVVEFPKSAPLQRKIREIPGGKPNGKENGFENFGLRTAVPFNNGYIRKSKPECFAIVEWKACKVFSSLVISITHNNL